MLVVVVYCPLVGRMYKEKISRRKEISLRRDGEIEESPRPRFDSAE